MKTQKQNEPKLSAEIKERFDEESSKCECSCHKGTISGCFPKENGECEKCESLYAYSADYIKKNEPQKEQ